jgi:hypothetical protein
MSLLLHPTIPGSVIRKSSLSSRWHSNRRCRLRAIEHAHVQDCLPNEPTRLPVGVPIKDRKFKSRGSVNAVYSSNQGEDEAADADEKPEEVATPSAMAERLQRVITESTQRINICLSDLAPGLFNPDGSLVDQDSGADRDENIIDKSLSDGIVALKRANARGALLVGAESIQLDVMGEQRRERRKITTLISELTSPERFGELKMLHDATQAKGTDIGVEIDDMELEGDQHKEEAKKSQEGVDQAIQETNLFMQDILTKFLKNILNLKHNLGREMKELAQAELKRKDIAAKAMADKLAADNIRKKAMKEEENHVIVHLQKQISELHGKLLDKSREIDRLREDLERFQDPAHLHGIDRIQNELITVRAALDSKSIEFDIAKENFEAELERWKQQLRASDESKRKLEKAAGGSVGLSKAEVDSIVLKAVAEVTSQLTLDHKVATDAQQKQLDALLREKNSFEHKLKSSAEDFAKSLEQINALQIVMNQKRQDGTSPEEERVGLQAEVHALQEEVSKLRSAASQSEKLLHSHLNKADQAKSNVTSLEKLIEGHTKELKQCHEDINRLKHRIASLQQEQVDLNGRIARLERENTDLAQNLLVSQHKNSINGVENPLTVEAQKSRSTSAEPSFDVNLRATIEQLRCELDAKGEQSAMLQKNVIAFERKVVFLEKTIEQLESQLRLAVVERDKLDQERHLLDREKSNLIAEKDNLLGALLSKSKRAELEIHQENATLSARDAARDRERDAKRDKERDPLRDAKRDKERDPLRDKDRDAARDRVRDAGRDSERDRRSDERRDEARDTASNVESETARIVHRDRLQPARLPEPDSLPPKRGSAVIRVADIRPKPEALNDCQISPRSSLSPHHRRVDGGTAKGGGWSPHGPRGARIGSVDEIIADREDRSPSRGDLLSVASSKGTAPHSIRHVDNLSSKSNQSRSKAQSNPAPTEAVSPVESLNQAGSQHALTERDEGGGRSTDTAPICHSSSSKLSHPIPSLVTVHAAAGDGWDALTHIDSGLNNHDRGGDIPRMANTLATVALPEPAEVDWQVGLKDGLGVRLKKLSSRSSLHKGEEVDSTPLVVPVAQPPPSGLRVQQLPLSPRAPTSLPFGPHYQGINGVPESSAALQSSTAEPMSAKADIVLRDSSKKPAGPAPTGDFPRHLRSLGEHAQPLKFPIAESESGAVHAASEPFPLRDASGRVQATSDSLLESLEISGAQGRLFRRSRRPRARNEEGRLVDTGDEALGSDEHGSAAEHSAIQVGAREAQRALLNRASTNEVNAEGLEAMLPVRVRRRRRRARHSGAMGSASSTSAGSESEGQTRAGGGGGAIRDEFTFATVETDGGLDSETARFPEIRLRGRFLEATRSADRSSLFPLEAPDEVSCEDHAVSALHERRGREHQKTLRRVTRMTRTRAELLEPGPLDASAGTALKGSPDRNAVSWQHLRNRDKYTNDARLLAPGHTSGFKAFVAVTGENLREQQQQQQPLQPLPSPPGQPRPSPDLGRARQTEFHDSFREPRAEMQLSAFYRKAALVVPPERKRVSGVGRMLEMNIPSPSVELTAVKRPTAQFINSAYSHMPAVNLQLDGSAPFTSAEDKSRRFVPATERRDEAQPTAAHLERITHQAMRVYTDSLLDRSTPIALSAANSAHPLRSAVDRVDSLPVNVTTRSRPKPSKLHVSSNTVSTSAGAMGTLSAGRSGRGPIFAEGISAGLSLGGSSAPLLFVQTHFPHQVLPHTHQHPFHAPPTQSEWTVTNPIVAPSGLRVTRSRASATARNTGRGRVDSVALSARSTTGSLRFTTITLFFSLFHYFVIYFSVKSR